MRLVIPATSINTDVCRLILSSHLLQYPPPVLVNWNRTYDGWGMQGSHLAKPKGIFEYLEALPAAASNDLVIVVDGLDTWFQLKPDTLITRYHEMTRRANDRIVQQLGPYLVEKNDIQSKVFFSTQNHCWPLEADSPGCQAIPESTLPPAIYGAVTDQVLDVPFENRFVRNRWLNSGALVGTAEGVRDVCGRAVEYSTQPAHDYGGSDQGVFADMFGEQELWRSTISSNGKPVTHTYNFDENVRYDLGISLDYEEALFLATIQHPDRDYWIHYNDHQEVYQISTAHNMSHPFAQHLPADIATALPPFSGTSLSSGNWGDRPLFTDVLTGVTPVGMHLNEWAKPGKTWHLMNDWDKMWFQPYAKAMIDSMSSVRLRAQSESGVKYGWRAGSALVYTDTGEEFAFDDVCGEFRDVLFANQTAVVS